MRTVKEALHEKRHTTENHIKQLVQEGKQGIRYTAMMPDIPFLVLGLLSDVGWMIHLTAGVIYFCQNGFRHAGDYIALAALAAVVFGVACIIYLNRIHEKEIATKRQKDLSFGVTTYSGAVRAIVGIGQILYTGISPALVWIVIGGFLNFAAESPIYFSFKKGIFTA